MLRDTVGKAWWPKYIARQFRRGKTFVVKRKNRQTGRRETRVQMFSGRYTVREAKALSRKIVSSRSRGTGYLRAGFGEMVGRMGGKRMGKRFSGIRARGRMARVKRPEATFAIGWAGMSRDALRRLGLPALQAAVRYVARVDMPRYVRRKMRERARKYSAR